jgi:hypothetical protein
LNYGARAKLCITTPFWKKFNLRNLSGDDSSLFNYSGQRKRTKPECT